MHFSVLTSTLLCSYSYFFFPASSIYFTYFTVYYGFIFPSYFYFNLFVHFDWSLLYCSTNSFFLCFLKLFYFVSIFYFYLFVHIFNHFFTVSLIHLSLFCLLMLFYYASLFYCLLVLCDISGSCILITSLLLH